jgi:hypothetical protein
MSTIKVNKIENTSTTNGGIEVDTSGHVTIDGQQLPTAGPLSNRNLIINGEMQVAQRGTGDSGVTSGPSWAADRFRLDISSCGTWTTANTTSNLPDGFSNSIKVDCTTAKATLTGTNNLFFSQYVEAQNLTHLGYGSSAAKQITLSFWVKSNKTGDYVVELDHGDAATFNGIKYTINSANTWEYKTLTYIGDTSNAINNDNGAGLFVQWCLAAGPTLSSGTFQSNTWQTTTANRFAGQTNLADSTDNEWSITGVQLEVGSKSTPFEHRSYGDELQRCQRYYFKMGTSFSMHGHQLTTNDNYKRNYFAFPVEMRDTPDCNGVSTISAGSFDAGIPVYSGTTTFGIIGTDGTATSYTTTTAFDADAEL